MQPENPALYAALLCERVLQDEDGVNVLFRVVDGFDFQLHGLTEGTPEGKSELSVQLRCVLFTKWGGPTGRYTERITLVDPYGEEEDLKSTIGSVNFELRGGFHFQQIRHSMNLDIQEPGMYAFRVYLNDQPFIDVPFKVDISYDNG